MTGLEMMIAFQRQIDDESADVKHSVRIDSDVMYYFLNLSQDVIIDELVVSGVEINTETKAKLKSLFNSEDVDMSLILASGAYRVFGGKEVSLNSNVRYILSEYITDGSSIVRVKNVSNDYVNMNINNGFKKPETGELCWSIDAGLSRTLIYPGTLSTYKYVYIKIPSKISRVSNSDIHESVHKDIVNKAVDLFINRSSNKINK